MTTIANAIADVLALGDVAPWDRDHTWCDTLTGLFDRLGVARVMNLLVEQGGSTGAIPLELTRVEVVDPHSMRGACFANGGTLPDDVAAVVTIVPPKPAPHNKHFINAATGHISMRDKYGKEVASTPSAQGHMLSLDVILEMLSVDAQAAFIAHVRNAVEAAGDEVQESMFEQIKYEISEKDRTFEPRARAAITTLSKMTDGRAFNRSARPRMYDRLPAWAHDERFAAAVAKGRGERHRW